MVLKLPFKPYEGEEEYIFISYKHKDAELVFPIIKQFHDAGFNVWYDAGLQYGADYEDMIVNKIDNASLVVPFITKNVIDDAYNDNDFMKKELMYAFSENLLVLPIYLENVELKSVYRLYLSPLQSIFRHEYPSEETFIDGCLRCFKQDFNIRPNENRSNLDMEETIAHTVSGSKGSRYQDNFSSVREMSNIPFKPYDGDGKYIFVSYKHADSERVYPLIKSFHDAGFNVWYDAGLQYGSSYIDSIADKIEGSSLFVICITENLINNASGKNEFMKKELAMAVGEIPILPIFLDDVKLKSAYRLYLSGLHSIFRHEYASEDEFIDGCLRCFEQDFKISPKRSNLDMEETTAHTVPGSKESRHQDNFK